MSDTAEALKVWDALKPMIDKEIERRTRSCVRAKKMVVTTEPDGSVIGVAEPFGDEMLIPYSSLLSGAKMDDSVWVVYFFNNASTMIAMTTGNGQFRFPSGSTTPESIETLLPDANIGSSWTTSNGYIVSGPTAETLTLSFSVSGIPDGSTIDSVTFSATFGSPYTGISILTASGASISSGPQTVSLSPLPGGNGTYTVEIVFKANGTGSTSDGSHSASVSITSPRVTVVYTPL